MMPLLLEKFCSPHEPRVAAEVAYKKILNRQRRHSTPAMIQPSEATLSSSPDIDEGFVKIEDHRTDEQRLKDEERRRAREQQDREIIEIQQEFIVQALPLDTMNGCFFSPYICLQQVERLARVPVRLHWIP